MRNGDRMHVGQAAACQPRLERGEPVARGIERVESSGVAHGRANGQGLAPGPGTEVHDHFAAFRVNQQGQQLGAFVLHLDGAARERVELVQRRLAGQPQAPGGVRRCDGLDGRLRKLLLHLGPLLFQGVDAQVQPGRRIEAFDQRPEVVTELRLQRLDQPLRQIVAMQFHQIRRFDQIAARQPVFLRLRQRTQQKIALGGKTQNCQATLQRAAAVLGEVGVEVFFAQDTIDGFSQRGPLPGTEALLAKIARHHHVRGMVKFENLLKKLGTTVE